jgi:PAS domain S-box-containing protein
MSKPYEFSQSAKISIFEELPGLVTGVKILDTDKRSEQHWRILEATLSSIADFAYTIDRAGRFLYVNKPLLDLWGKTSQEALGKNFFDLQYPDEVARRLQGEIEEVFATGKKITDETPHVSSKGAVEYFEYIFSPVIGASGTVDFVAGTICDITVRKDSEKHLAQMEARYRGLLEAAPDAMVVVDEGGSIVLLNVQAEKQFGYSRDELVGKKVKSIIPKGFAERLIADGTRTAAEALAQQIGTGIELLGLRKDGKEFPIEIMLSPLENTEGILVTAAIRNITLRKAAEQHLAQTEARYRGLLEAAPDGMVVVNLTGQIVLLNAQAEKQFGYHRDELLGQNVKDIIPEGFAERLISDSLRTTAEAQAQQIDTGIELHGRRKDGTRFPIEIMLSPLESAEGVFITSAIRDISERKQLERQLHQSQKMEAVGQLTGGIAHDFNNLLTVILGNLGLLELLVSDNDVAVKRVKTAQKAAARGADITRRLLVFSSNEELNPTFVLLEDSIYNTIEMASRALGSDIKITTQLDKSVPPLFIDSAALESALLNLVVNARDAMPLGGAIFISSQLKNLHDSHPAVQAGDLKEGRYVCVHVTDTGHGMSRETLERACEPFFTTKPHDKGTGLGLAMVYGFAKKSGGIVQIYSELGLGTTVAFYLPIVSESAHPAQVDTPRSLHANLAGTVLVVDDELDILEVAAAYLTEMGLTVIQARDGAEALKMIGEHSEIDLIVTDIVMAGGMNGEDLVRKVRVSQPDLKVIYSSGFPAEVLAKRTMQLVEGPLLRKPYQRADFSAIVHRVMESGNSVAPEFEDSLSVRGVQRKS